MRPSQAILLRIVLILLSCWSCGPQAQVPQQLPASGQPAAAPRGARLLPTTTAAAELLCLIADPEDVLALPEQADRYSVENFRSGGWEAKPRFAKYEAEVLIAYQPLLVINHRWQSEDTSRVLQKAGIPVVSLESGTTYAAVRASIQQLGGMLGRELRARGAIAELDRRVAVLSARAPARKPKVLIYTNDGTTGWAAGTQTTAHTILELAGFDNAAALSGIQGHAVCSFETLLAMDPEWIVFAKPAAGEDGTPTRTILEQSPVLKGLRARQSGHFLELSSALLSSDSHHIITAAEELMRQYEQRAGSAK